MNSYIITNNISRLRKKYYSNIWSIPVYNEESSIPNLINHLKQIANNSEVLFCFVNNGSEDKSFEILKNELRINTIIDYILLDVDIDIRSCGIPRKIGFEFPLEHIKINDDCIFYSSDANSLPHAKTVSECNILIREKSNDLVSFPIIYDRSQIQSSLAANKNWIHYFEYILNREELLNESLSKIGYIKVRGKGFAISSKMYFQIGGHQQPMDDNGNPLKGESHLLGKKVKKNHGKITSSMSPVIVSPRRFLVEIIEKGMAYRIGGGGIYYEPKRFRFKDILGDSNITELKLKNDKSFFIKLCKVLIQNNDEYKNTELLSKFYDMEKSSTILKTINSVTENLSYEYSGQLNSLIDFDKIYSSIFVQV